jgi:Zn-finger nucleic acid-binding protein
MHQVTARARSGYGLMLDQCPQCGGVWCDRWELYPLDAGEAHRLDPLDDDRLHAGPPPPSAPGRCPRCTAPLRPFSDPVLPPDSAIERCAVCDGMWLNRGSLARAKGRTAAGDDYTRRVDTLTRALGNQATWPQVSNLDAATYADDEAPTDDRQWLEWLRSAGPWIALAALLRLVLR